MADIRDPRSEGHDLGLSFIPRWGREVIPIFLLAIGAAKILDVLGVAKVIEKKFPDALPLGSVVVAVVLVGWVLSRLTRFVRDHPSAWAAVNLAILGVTLAVLFVVLGIQHLVFVGPMLGQARDPREWPSHDLPGDRAGLLRIRGTRQAAPGDELTIVFELRNEGSEVWRNRSFCRWDELNDGDNLRTEECVPIRNTRPGGVAEIPVKVKIPPRKGSLSVEFKMADTEANAWYFNPHDYDPVVLEIEVSD